MTHHPSPAARRRIALAAGALVLGTVAALAPASGAHAYTASYTQWDSGLDVIMDATETGDLVSGGQYVAGPKCSSIATWAYQHGVPFSTTAKSNCTTWLVTCAKQARDKGNANSGTRFYAEGYRCIDR